MKTYVGHHQLRRNRPATRKLTRRLRQLRVRYHIVCQGHQDPSLDAATDHARSQPLDAWVPPIT